MLVFINYWIEKCTVKHWNNEPCLEVSWAGPVRPGSKSRLAGFHISSHYPPSALVNAYNSHLFCNDYYDDDYDEEQATMSAANVKTCFLCPFLVVKLSFVRWTVCACNKHKPKLWLSATTICNSWDSLEVQHMTLYTYFKCGY